MKEQILKLRKEGKTYNQIVKIVGCSKSTVCYHCGEGQKEKSAKRVKVQRKKLYYKIQKKLLKFLRSKVSDFNRGQENVDLFNFYSKVCDKPVCYLTGRKIDLENTSSYHLDHIVPRAKGGINTIENIGLATKEANFAKHDMKLNDFIQLCKEVCENQGYKVVKRLIKSK